MVYSDKLQISVIDLTHIELATEEDIRMQCEAREDYYRLQLSQIRAKQRLEEQLKERDAKIVELTSQNQQLLARIRELESPHP